MPRTGGCQSHFRRIVAGERPKPVAEAYLHLKTLPGEQAQVDWAHFGTVRIGRAERRLMGFVMVLSYSRRIFLRFYLDAAMGNFLPGHVAAFEAWQGVPRELWYDNLRSVVAERRGNAIRFPGQVKGDGGGTPLPSAVRRPAHGRTSPLDGAGPAGGDSGRAPPLPAGRDRHRRPGGRRYA